MQTQNPKFKIRLGIFIALGVVLFILAIFIIGRQKNVFDQVITVSSTFENISGLQVGSNVRFSGINVGTVDNISFINDSTVLVIMIIKSEMQEFIKTNSEVSIGTEGIIGDRFINIVRGSISDEKISDGQVLQSSEPVETDAIMASLAISAGNAEIITSQLAGILWNLNNGKGTFGSLISDTSIAENFRQTMLNLKRSSKGLDQNMNAAKESFLLKGYYNRKRKAAEKKQ